MKHGVAFRKFSRTSSHRNLMLRNLVTSLFEHEQIKTTLPKARDAARLAEKIITLGKKGHNAAQARASSFLLKPSILTKLFSTFAQRYADRPGGYTRIHKFGNRQGDNAPHAILELVDNPRDLKWEMTARAVGRELLKDKVNSDSSEAVVDAGLGRVVNLLRAEKGLEPEEKGLLRPMTRWNLQKVLQFRGPRDVVEMSKKARVYADDLMATPMAHQTMHEEVKAKYPHTPQPRRLAGHKRLAETRPALVIAQGALGPGASPPTKGKKKRVYVLENALTQSF
ncbi:ribosomal protein L17 [Crepidotus variabilis]|uniref:Ribosomal protein L17 n=1 Tax=Crepidotus variabilis TaxID=179855 RepID=A0A9P6JTQ8_9AGAR|nr:ribosomal protein L17 [Crepidotus variabilis]